MADPQLALVERDVKIAGKTSSLQRRCISNRVWPSRSSHSSLSHTASTVRDNDGGEQPACEAGRTMAIGHATCVMLNGLRPPGFSLVRR